MRFLINTKKFASIGDILFKPFLVISIILLFVGLAFAFFISPDDYQQGSTVRIILGKEDVKSLK